RTHPRQPHARSRRVTSAPTAQERSDAAVDEDPRRERLRRDRRTHAHHGGGGRGLHRQTGQARSAAGRGGPPGHCPLRERRRVMNFRRILLAVPLASLLATVGAPARSAAVVLAPTTVDVSTLEFEPTQNALAGSYGVMTIKPLPGGTLLAFTLRAGYPNTVYTIWTVYNRLSVPRPTDATK